MSNKQSLGLQPDAADSSWSERITGISATTVSSLVLIVILLLLSVSLVIYYKLSAQTMQEEVLQSQREHAISLTSQIEIYLSNNAQIANTLALTLAPLRSPAMIE